MSFFNLNTSQKFSRLPAQCATVLNGLGINAILLANSLLANHYTVIVLNLYRV